MYGLADTSNQGALYCGGPLAPFYPSCWSSAWDSLFGGGTPTSQLAPPPAPTGSVLTTPPASGEEAQAQVDTLLNQQMAAQQALAASQVQSSWLDQLSSGIVDTSNAAGKAATTAIDWTKWILIGAVFGGGILLLSAAGSGGRRRR